MSRSAHARPPALAMLVIVLGVSVSSPARAGGSITVQLAGWHRVTRELGAEWRIRVGVTVPLDRLAGASGGIAQSGESPEVPPSPPAVDEAAPPRVEAPVPPAPPPSRPRSPLSPELARETVRVVLRAQGDGAARRRLTSLASRANTSAWLPELRLAGGRATDQSLRLNATSDDPNRYVQSGGSDLWGEVRLTWKLDRLVFSSDELAVERLAEQRADGRLKLVTRVFQMLAAWHRARVRQSDATLLPEEQDAALLDRIEAEVWLDVMSDGWFSQRVRRADRGVRADDLDEAPDAF